MESVLIRYEDDFLYGSDRDSIRIKTRSIMGTEIPLVESESSGDAPTVCVLQHKGISGSTKQAFEKGEEADDPALHGGKCSVPVSGEYQEDAEAGKCAEEYHDSSL